MARFTAFPSDSEDDSSSSSSSSTSAPRHVSKNPPKRQRPSFSARTPTASSRSSSPDSIQDEDEDEDESADSIMDENELEEATSREKDVRANQPTPWAQQLDLEPGRVHVMQASLFRMPELAKAQAKDKLSFLKHRRSSDANQEAKNIPTRASFAQPRSQPPPRKYVRVASSASVAAGREGVYIDAGLSLGRSFRIGWGPGDKSTRVGEVKEASTSCVVIVIVYHLL